MMIPRKNSRERETYVLQLLSSTPDLSIRAINRAVVARFGQEIRPHRLLELRRTYRSTRGEPQ